MRLEFEFERRTEFQSFFGKGYWNSDGQQLESEEISNQIPYDSENEFLQWGVEHAVYKDIQTV